MIQDMDTSALQSQFKENKPFSYLIIDNFLEPKPLLELISALKEEEFYFKMSDLFMMFQTNDLVSSSNPEMKRFYDFFKSNEFIGFCEKITGIKYTPNKIDLQGSIYQDTNFLLCHDDQLEGRKLAFLIYLSDMDEQEGGALTLFGEDDGIPIHVEKRIFPKINRFVCFEVTETSFHEVEEVLVDKQRLALGGWLH